MVPGKLQCLIFETFDEDEKGGQATEKHFGVYYASGQPKYSLNYAG